MIAATTRRALMTALAALALAGCGKRGDPKPPEGRPVTYPRSYPAPVKPSKG